MSSFRPKNQQNFFKDFYPSKQRSDQKTLLYNHVKLPLISYIKCLYFLDLASFVGFLVETMPLKSPFENN